MLKKASLLIHLNLCASTSCLEGNVIHSEMLGFPQDCFLNYRAIGLTCPRTSMLALPVLPAISLLARKKSSVENYWSSYSDCSLSYLTLSTHFQLGLPSPVVALQKPFLPIPFQSLPSLAAPLPVVLVQDSSNSLPMPLSPDCPVLVIPAPLSSHTSGLTHLPAPLHDCSFSTDSVVKGAGVEQGLPVLCSTLGRNPRSLMTGTLAHFSK